MDNSLIPPTSVDDRSEFMILVRHEPGNERSAYEEQEIEAEFVSWAGRLARRNDR